MKAKLSIKSGDLEHVLGLLRSEVEAGDGAALDALLDKLAEEPRVTLSKCELVRREAPAVTSLKAAVALHRDYGRLLDGLSLAAVELLVRLYLLHGVPAEWLSGTWEAESAGLETALLRYLYERDAGDAERTRDARRQGGLIRKAMRSEELEERNRRICRRADELEGILEPHKIAGYLGKRFGLGAPQIRNILRASKKKRKSS